MCLLVVSRTAALDEKVADTHSSFGATSRTSVFTTDGAQKKLCECNESASIVSDCVVDEKIEVKLMTKLPSIGYNAQGILDRMSPHSQRR